MLLDIEKYMPYLAKFDISRVHKEEMIRTVWGLMESHVDQAFGLHPVQQAQNSKRKSIAEIPRRRIDSKNRKMNKTFNSMSRDRDIKKRKA